MLAEKQDPNNKIESVGDILSNSEEKFTTVRCIAYLCWCKDKL